MTDDRPWSGDVDPLVPKEEFLSVLNSLDGLTVAIRGHLLVERVLDALLVERLPAPHTLELRRLSFSLKLDLVAALGLVDEESRRLGQALSTIRNRFAHRTDASVGDREVGELRSAFSDWHRQALAETEREVGHPLESLDIFRRAVAFVLVTVEGSYSKLVVGKVRDEVFHEILSDWLRPAPADSLSRTSTEMEKRVSERLRQRKHEI